MCIQNDPWCWVEVLHREWPVHWTTLNWNVPFGLNKENVLTLFKRDCFTNLSCNIEPPTWCDRTGLWPNLITFNFATARRLIRLSYRYFAKASRQNMKRGWTSWALISCRWIWQWSKCSPETSPLFAGVGSESGQQVAPVSVVWGDWEYSYPGGTSILWKARGCSLEIFNLTQRGTKILFCGCGLKCFSPLRGTKILFWGRGLKCFSPLRGNISETRRYLLS